MQASCSNYSSMPSVQYDNLSDDESDAMISDWEQNHVAAMEEQLERNLDQDEVLAIFDAQHEDESSETGSEVEGDGRT